MKNKHMTPHPHLEVMKLFIADVEQFGMDAHTHWRWRQAGSLGWRLCDNSPGWHLSCEYSRIPRTILINGRDVPEPARAPLDYDQEYWIPAIHYSGRVSQHAWRDDTSDHLWLAAGLIHLTKEAAAAHAEALLSFTALPQ